MPKRKKFIEARIVILGKGLSKVKETLSPRKKQRKTTVASQSQVLDTPIEALNTDEPIGNELECENVFEQTSNQRTKFRLNHIPQPSIPSSPMKFFRLNFPLASKIQQIFSPKKSKTQSTSPNLEHLTKNPAADTESDNISFLARRQILRDSVPIDR
ncbi:hypothetical protein BDP27DRAFT_1418123 [Rhodocollybia butyracea]|uniref:Uncharacterized protein n=1 Tax=Rhodocollybia butyracea TaxID=206335 RepID=A0A9P5PU97_9AGAR|nr:hypothetical protein BDP27DRAFT_1418123 [Rhodocollybia butyracea]